MEIHRQKCQNCKSRSLRNIVVRFPGHNEKIYVQCRNCKELVARYVVGYMGYFHHGKGIESFVRSVENSGDITSAKNLSTMFKQMDEEVVAEFNEALKELERQGKNDDLEDS